MNENIIDTIFIPTAYAIYGIDVDQQNNLWIATQDTGLVKFDGNDLTFIKLQPIFTVTPQHNQAYCVQIDNENNIWIGAIGGLAKYDGQNWTVYDHLNSPLQYWPDIWSIKFDSQNNLWFGHYYGAGRLSNNIWTFWYNSPFDYLMTVAIAKDGIVWLGPSWGFAVELSNDLTWNSLDFLILPNSTHQIAVDTNNVKWFGKFDSDENIIAYNGSYFNPLIIPPYP